MGSVNYFEFHCRGISLRCLGKYFDRCFSLVKIWSVVAVTSLVTVGGCTIFPTAGPQ